ncbi:tetratricopeptide repeat protein [Roseomonas marmotae]|uniref:Tetratricopeptide repeat protein n=1 Tax=Roseomonas marmotae TaxID=2768161 RepID=A0ABS3KGM8_9PROT|nr:tetratricopeptide repeat protein [Roseomonas marmotae]MBO1076628.1 tetratricopeptide repeat protein [Roseomonas marmotae]QTI79631.1 tetratricopeptide repeat protein [Roseomonas marmotae]
MICTGLLRPLLVAALVSATPRALLAAPALLPEAGVAPGVSATMRQGMEATVRGDLDAAQRRFEALRLASPTSAAPYLGLAEVAARRNDAAGAEAQLRAGIDASPRAPELQRALGRLQVLQGRADEAIASFDAAIALDPADLATPLEIADLLNQRLGQPQRALPYYEAVLRRDSGNGAARYGHGLALARSGQAKAALEELTVAASLRPQDPLPDYARAQILLQSGAQNAALTAYDAALARSPGFAQARAAKGSLLLSLRRPPEARAEFEAALKQSPNLLAALMGLGMAQQEGGDKAGATASYRKALAADPDNLLAMNNLAWLLADGGGDLDEALALASRAVERAPGTPAFLDTLGWVHWRRGEALKGETHLARAAGMQANAEVLTRLGIVRAGLGRSSEAAGDFRRALQITPHYRPAEQELSRLR